MKTPLILMTAVCAFAVTSARADQSIASVQQALKDQGFYYGEITGTKDADTSAAIRRYQIRNGLKITGELSPETEKSLGVHGATAAPSAPSPRPQRNVTPPPSSAVTPSPDLSDLRDDRTVAAAPQLQPRHAPDFAPASPDAGYGPGPQGVYPPTTGVFAGTPFEGAPTGVQRHVTLGAQSRLAQQGYYRGVLDGAFGAGTASALRTFQSRFGLQPSGRLDMETLAALGLLPGQRAPGIDAPRRRIYRSPRVLPGVGERIYVPR